MADITTPINTLTVTLERWDDPSPVGCNGLGPREKSFWYLYAWGEYYSPLEEGEVDRIEDTVWDIIEAECDIDNYPDDCSIQDVLQWGIVYDDDNKPYLIVTPKE